MNDMFATDAPEMNIDPVDLQNTLMGFLGQTYREVSQYDSHIVSPNQFLAPKKHEFKQLAERVIQEVRPKGPAQYPQHRPQQIHHHPTNVVSPLNNNVQQQHTDPNQMEFSFDNSVTAITINNRLDDIEKRLKRMDNVLQKVLCYLETHDSENSKQTKLHSEIPDSNLKN